MEKLFSKADITHVLKRLKVPSVKIKVYIEHADLFENPVYENYTVKIYTASQCVHAVTVIAGDYLKDTSPDYVLSLLEEEYADGNKRVTVRKESSDVELQDETESGRS